MKGSIQVDPKLVKLDKEFEKTFIIDSAKLEALIESMNTKGFDAAFPLIIWKETNTLIAGHTRRRAAIAAGIIRVPVVYKSFAGRAEVLAWMSREQYHRRETTFDDKVRSLYKNIEALNAQKNKKTWIKLTYGVSASTATRMLQALNDENRLKEILTGVCEEDEGSAKKAKKAASPARGKQQEARIIARIDRFTEFLKGLSADDITKRVDDRLMELRGFIGN